MHHIEKKMGNRAVTNTMRTKNNPRLYNDVTKFQQMQNELMTDHKVVDIKTMMGYFNMLENIKQRNVQVKSKTNMQRTPRTNRIASHDGKSAKQYKNLMVFK